MVCGFHDPHLVVFLSELGIHVDCIIKVQSEEYPSSDLSGRSADDLEEPKDDRQLSELHCDISPCIKSRPRCVKVTEL